MSYLSNRDLVNRDLVINIHYFQSKINKKAGFGLNMAKICVFDEISRSFYQFHDELKSKIDAIALYDCFKTPY